MRLVPRLADFILNEPVGPCDADNVDRRIIRRIECQRYAVVKLAPIERTRLDFNQRILRQFETADALQANAYPILQLTLVAQEMDAAISIDAGVVDPPGCVEVGIHLLWRSRRIPL